MRVRLGFVTNSSSSSYICNICGRVESGWDIGLYEAEMFQCVNGHTFCCNEALIQYDDRDKLIKLILENEWNKYKEYINNHGYEDIIIPEEKLNEMDFDELVNLSSGDNSYYEIPEEFCPICNFIEYSEEDLNKYLLKEYGISRDEVFADVKKYNKRRKKLYNNEYITYVCKKFNLNPTEIVAGWKEKFGTYANFKKYIES